jgi:hypothetical protein
MHHVGKALGALALGAVLLGVGLARPVAAQPPGQQDKTKAAEKTAPAARPAEPATSAAQPDSITESAVTVGGQKIVYRAVAGTITVGSTEAVDGMLGLDGRWLPDSGMAPPDPAKPDQDPATARMFYAAYFKKDAGGEARPVMFFYNGGPGSSTMWLHMGSFGPRRIVTPDTEHKEAAPYTIVESRTMPFRSTFSSIPATTADRGVPYDSPKRYLGEFHRSYLVRKRRMKRSKACASGSTP